MELKSGFGRSRLCTRLMAIDMGSIQAIGLGYCGVREER